MHSKILAGQLLGLAQDDLLGGDALMLGCALAFSEAFSLGFFLRLLPQASKMNEHPTPHSSEVDH